ncbi:MAG: response regulator [Microcoleaceae cyanobacterium]
MNLEYIDNYKGDILAVDDTPENLRLLTNLLREYGYKVRPVPNGSMALSVIEMSAPDLILLDIMMPDINGYEVCQKLKNKTEYAHIPIIFISAIDDMIDKIKAFEVGGVDYITKPFQVEEVLARVETHLKIHLLQKSLQDKNNELESTLKQLRKAQNHLVQSEKMAALGQLVAGIAHEINTPLGAIRSSIENITSFLSNNLEKIPQFLEQLSLERQQELFALSRNSLKHKVPFSSKEKRKFKRTLAQLLSKENIDNSDIIADTLVDLGVYEDITDLLPLLKDKDGEDILNVAYQISSVEKSAQTIKIATDRAAKVVFALKTYARHDQTGVKTETNITEGIDTVLTLYHNHLKHGVEVIQNYDDQLPTLMAYADELNQVWTNLIHNALQAMNNQGTLIINTFQHNNHIIVQITDSGMGMTPDILSKIFDPFFTTKSAGEGSGLGLDIVKKIIKKHEGKIEVESVPGETTFTVTLPI